MSRHSEILCCAFAEPHIGATHRRLPPRGIPVPTARRAAPRARSWHGARGAPSAGLRLAVRARRDALRPVTTPGLPLLARLEAARALLARAARAPRRRGRGLRARAGMSREGASTRRGSIKGRGGCAASDAAHERAARRAHPRHRAACARRRLRRATRGGRRSREARRQPYARRCERTALSRARVARSRRCARP